MEAPTGRGRGGGGGGGAGQGEPGRRREQAADEAGREAGGGCEAG
jgi:hypothetical protein